MILTLARLKVDVIVTGGAEAVIAAKQATSVIPIIFAVAADPLGTGLVASLARPGGNVTGVVRLSSELIGNAFAQGYFVILEAIALLAPNETKQTECVTSDTHGGY